MDASGIVKQPATMEAGTPGEIANDLESEDLKNGLSRFTGPKFMRVFASNQALKVDKSFGHRYLCPWPVHFSRKGDLESPAKVRTRSWTPFQITSERDVASACNSARVSQKGQPCEHE